jgi:hypothetical protein
MDEFTELYNYLVEEGLTDLSKEEFLASYQSGTEKNQDLHTYLTEENLTDLDTAEFNNKYFPQKKNPSGTENTNTPVNGLESDLELPILEEEQELTEEDYFTGGFGDALRAFDSVSPVGIGDFIDDMARAVAGGHNQGIAAENASDLLLRGSLSTEEDIQSYLDANKNTQKYGASKEMQEYQKTYEENGKGFLGVVLGLAKSGLTVLPELILSSFTSMASNTDALGVFGATIGASAATGAITAGTAATFVLPGGGTLVGAAAGAATGAAAALPYAFAAAGSALEMGATFSELLQEEADGQELTASLIKEILNDKEKYTRIRNKAVARGAIIGAIDAYTGKIGGKVASKILTKSGMQTAKEATKKQVIKSVLGAGAVEGVGGSLGEATARVAIGQDLDISEIALEGLAEIPGGVKDLISARFSKPKYKVNGEKVTAEVLDDLIETMTLNELVETKITIDNDYEGRAKTLQDKIVKLSTEQSLLDANPDLNKATLDEMTRLQLELDKIDGNKTEIAKAKASKIKQEIKDLQEGPLQDEGEKVSVTEVTTEEAKESLVLENLKNEKLGLPSILINEPNIEIERQRLNDGLRSEAQVTDEVIDVNINEQYNQLSPEEKLNYKEQAQDSLQEEAEDQGLTEFDFTEEDITERAAMLLNEDTQSEGFKVEDNENVVGTTVDKKGRTVTYISKTTKKDGVTKTSFNFNRDDKDSSQRSAKGVTLDEGLPDGYKVSEDDAVEGYEITKVYEVREGDNGNNAATVEFTSPEGSFRGEVILEKIDANDSVSNEEQTDIPSSKLKEKINHYQNILESDTSLDWQKTQAQEFLDNPGKFADEMIEMSNRALEQNENDTYSKIILEEFTQLRNDLNSKSELESNYEQTDQEVSSPKSKNDSSVIQQKSDDYKPNDPVIVTRPVQISNAPKGVFVNVGMVEGQTDVEISQETIESRLPKGVKVIKSKIKKKGVGETEDTLLLHLSRPLTKTEMKEFLVSNKQQAIGQMVDGEGILYGNDQVEIDENWGGEFGPQYFPTFNGVVLEETQKTDNKLTIFEDDDINDIMFDVQSIMDRANKKGKPDTDRLNKLVSRIDKYVMDSDAYKSATDSQKKAMEANVRVIAGVDKSKAISKGRILGVISDIKNLSITEKLKIATRIIKLTKTANKDLVTEIKELIKKGLITTQQGVDILNKFSKVNILNENSIRTFVDYMGRVMNSAEYAQQVRDARSKITNAKKNVKNKIGISEGLVPNLTRLFSIDPTLIPADVFGTYLSLVEMFSPKKSILKLPSITEVTEMSNLVLKQVDIQESLALDLADKYAAFDGKILNKEGNISYSATIKEMLKQGIIDETDLEVMQNYKSLISPSEKAVPMSETEISEKKAEYIKEINKLKLEKRNGLPTEYENKKAKQLFDLLKGKDLLELSLRDLENIIKVSDNINMGYFPNFAQIMVEKLNALNFGGIISNSIYKAKLLPISKAYSKMKGIITRSNGILEMFRRNALFYTDQLLGDFKTKSVFNSLFGPAAKAISKYRFELKSVQSKIEKAQTAVMKSFGRSPNEFVMSKYKQMTYMLQLEFNSNPGNKYVNQSSKFLKETINKIRKGKTRFGDEDILMLEEILSTYSVDGQIDIATLYESFNDAEKASIKTIQDINIEQQEKAAITSTIIRGQAFNPRNNYIHLNVLQAETTGGKVSELMSGESFVNSYNNSLLPSTKAKSLIERTGVVSAINFDVYASVERGSKFVLMDYHMTEPIRTARRSLRITEKLITEGTATNEQVQIYNALNEAFEEATSNLLTNAYTQSSVVDAMMVYLKKTGYRAILAGGGRFLAELTSNLSFAFIVDPKAFMAGMKLNKVFSSEMGPNIMNNLNSISTNRIFPTSDLSGKLVDTSVINESTGVKGGKAKGKVENFLGKMWNQTGQRWVKGVEFTADTLISTPDKIVMRKLWIGSLEIKFKEITGKSPDLKKIAANDQTYLEANRESLDVATDWADTRSVMAGATDNAFMGILKGTSKPNQTGAVQAFNQFNNFMTRFLIFEYVTARTGIMNMIGRGDLSKVEGAKLIAGVTTRMMTYTMMSQVLATALTDLFDTEEDDDEIVLYTEEGDEGKPFEKQLGQAFASTFTTLLLGRDFGNATKMGMNYAVEEFNKEYLDFLREGEYDQYKDAIQYNIVPKGKQGKGSDLFDFAQKMIGAYAPALASANLLVSKLTEPDKKTESAIERQQKERYIRVPLEIMGHLGFVPFYKDIRKVVLADIYGDLSKAEATVKDKKRAAKERLQGYDNQTDMKRYDYDLWVKQFGEGAVDYNDREALKEIKRAKSKLKRQMKDEYYDYTPKKKKKSSGSPFGPGKRKSGGVLGRNKKSSSPFGAKNKKQKRNY